MTELVNVCPQAHTAGQAAGVAALYVGWVGALGYLSFLYEHSNQWLHAVHAFTYGADLIVDHKTRNG